MSSVSNGLYFLTLPLVSVMHVIYRKIRHARYLYIKRNVEKVWGARYTLGTRYLSKNTVINEAALTQELLYVSICGKLLASQVLLKGYKEMDITSSYTANQKCE